MESLPPKQSLPQGWKAELSKRYPGKVYYFNILTGASTWECPELVPEEMVDEKEDYGHKLSCGEKVLQGTNIETAELHLPNSSHSQLKKKKNSYTATETKKRDSRICKISSSDISKSLNPPTAVVVPVIHKANSSVILNSPLKNKLKINKMSDHAVVKNLSLKSKLKVNKTSDRVQPLQKIKLKRSPISELKSNKKKGYYNQISEGNIKEFQFKLNALKERQMQKDPNNTGSFESEGRSCHNKPGPCNLYKSVGKVNSTGISAEQNVSSTTDAESDNCVEDVEMIDVSLDLANLDDLEEPRDLSSYYLVVDTNILLGDLKVIDEIKDTPIEGCGPPHIFIPWVVIEELDSIKSRSSKNRGRAADAIRYLNSVLKTKHPRFHGQSPQEALKWSKLYSKCNDDKLLECCMGLGDKIPQEKIILLTNDKNLANKALICDLKVHTWDSMMKTLKTDVIFKVEEMKKKSPRKKKTNKVKTQKNMCIEKSDSAELIEGTLVEKRNNCKQEIHTLMSNARQILKCVLEPFLEAEMFEVYGNHWRAFQIERKLLCGVLQAVMKYWTTVFSCHFTEKDERNFDLLYQKVNRPEGFFGNRDECLLILTAIEDVFCQINRRWPHINAPVEKIQDLRVSCVEAFLKFKDLEKSIDLAESRSSLNTFQSNWAVLNQLCGLIMDFCQLPHTFQYEKPIAFPAESDFRNMICNLYPSVDNLKRLMSSLIESLHKSAPAYDILKKLHKALKDFIPSLQIQCEFSPDPYFSVKALQRFCLSPDNKEMIEIGFKQLETFFSSLDEALAVLMSAAFRKKCQERMICD